MVSVICPIYNEQGMLSRNSVWLQKLSSCSELIFVDGKSIDQGVEIAEQCGKVIHSKKGRAAQMNMGAAAAKGDVLLFLHADTIISPDTISSIESSMKDYNCIGGCLTQRIDGKGMIYRLIEGLGNVRAKITKVFYGDQGMFVRKDIFLKLGGFPKVPIMEDVIFSKRLRRSGKTVVLMDKILTSSRRWDKKGIVKPSLLYSLVNILFWLRLPLEKIKLFYDDLR